MSFYTKFAFKMGKEGLKKKLLFLSRSSHYFAILKHRFKQVVIVRKAIEVFFILIKVRSTIIFCIPPICKFCPENNGLVSSTYVSFLLFYELFVPRLRL